MAAPNWWPKDLRDAPSRVALSAALPMRLLLLLRLPLLLLAIPELLASSLLDPGAGLPPRMMLCTRPEAGPMMLPWLAGPALRREALLAPLWLKPLAPPALLFRWCLKLLMPKKLLCA